MKTPNISVLTSSQPAEIEKMLSAQASIVVDAGQAADLPPVFYIDENGGFSRAGGNEAVSVNLRYVNPFIQINAKVCEDQSRPRHVENITLGTMASYKIYQGDFDQDSDTDLCIAFYQANGTLQGALLLSNATLSKTNSVSQSSPAQEPVPSKSTAKATHYQKLPHDLARQLDKDHKVLTPEPVEFIGVDLPAGTTIEKIQGGEVYEITTEEYRQFQVNGLAYEGKWFRIYADGHMQLAGLAAPASIDGIEYGPGEIYFNKSENVLRGTLNRRTLVKGIWYKAQCEIGFYESGKVFKGTLDNATKINGIEYTGEEIFYYKNGRVKSGILKSNTRIDGITFKANNDLWYYENGHVQYGALAAPAVIDGKQYPANALLTFSNDGHVNARWSDLAR